MASTSAIQTSLACFGMCLGKMRSKILSTQMLPACQPHNLLSGRAIIVLLRERACLLSSSKSANPTSLSTSTTSSLTSKMPQRTVRINRCTATARDVILHISHWKEMSSDSQFETPARHATALCRPGVVNALILWKLPWMTSLGEGLMAVDHTGRTADIKTSRADAYWCRRSIF